MAKEKEVKQENVLSEEMMAAVNAKIEAMFAEATKKAEEMVKAAEERVAEIENGKKAVSEDTAKANAELEEYVEVKLFKDNDKYKDDVFVAVNGENCRIKRGIKTKIKRKFALVLEQSDIQDYETSQLMDRKEAEYRESAREHNIE